MQIPAKPKPKSVPEPAVRLEDVIYYTSGPRDLSWIRNERIIAEYKRGIVDGRHSHVLHEFLRALDYPEPWPNVHTIDDILYKNGNIEIIFSDDNQPEDPTPDPIRDNRDRHRVQQSKHEESGLSLNSVSDAIRDIYYGPATVSASRPITAGEEAFRGDIAHHAQFQSGSSDSVEESGFNF